MNYLLVNLAVADLMVAVFFAQLHVFIHTYTHPDGLTGDVLCKLLTGGALGWVGGTSSAFTLLAVATERYYAVNYPHGNKGKLTTKKLKVRLKDRDHANGNTLQFSLNLLAIYKLPP